MIEDIAILVENKSKIIDYTIDYIKRTDSWRLKKDKHVKCRRDLAYIIDAFIDDLQNRARRWSRIPIFITMTNYN